MEWWTRGGGVAMTEEKDEGDDEGGVRSWVWEPWSASHWHWASAAALCLSSAKRRRCSSITCWPGGKRGADQSGLVFWSVRAQRETTAVNPSCWLPSLTITSPHSRRPCTAHTSMCSVKWRECKTPAPSRHLKKFHLTLRISNPCCRAPSAKACPSR